MLLPTRIQRPSHAECTNQGRPANTVLTYFFTSCLRWPPHTASFATCSYAAHRNVRTRAANMCVRIFLRHLRAYAAVLCWLQSCKRMHARAIAQILKSSVRSAKIGVTRVCACTRSVRSTEKGLSCKRIGSCVIAAWMHASTQASRCWLLCPMSTTWHAAKCTGQGALKVCNHKYGIQEQGCVRSCGRPSSRNKQMYG